MADYPYAVAILLGKRKEKARNVLLGSDTVVIRALERRFSIRIEPYSSSDPKVFSYVERDTQIPIEEHSQCTFWRNPPISKNQEVLKYIVGAMSPTGTKLQELDSFVRSFSKETEYCRDFDVLYWRITQALKTKQVFKWDEQPWESKKWFSRDLRGRLYRLYFDLRAFVFAKEDAKAQLKEMNISDKKAAFLKKWPLSNRQVERALSLLSMWRRGSLSDIQAAFLVTTIWSPYEIE